ncbi:MAG: efflux RND transporter periplasmic adaptor subunit, partial [Acidobacteria bacterium]|nr:efflux RND transporter periplasmic adaptor subunit [Acidobacteriota bacterium]
MKDETIAKTQSWTKRRNKTRMLVLLLAVLLLVVIAARVWWGSDQSVTIDEMGDEGQPKAAEVNVVALDQAAQQNIGLKLEAAQMKTIVQTIQTTGSVGPNETRVGHIRPLARGRIEKVYVRLGDRVRAGQPLL